MERVSFHIYIPVKMDSNKLRKSSTITHRNTINQKFGQHMLTEVFSLFLYFLLLEHNNNEHYESIR